MDLRVNRVELQRELEACISCVERRTTIPILSHVRLTGRGDRLEIAGTDLEVGLRTSCDAELYEEGVICVEVKNLLEIVRSSVGEEVTLRIDQVGMLTILVGKTRVKLRGLSGEDFPSMAEVDEGNLVRLLGNEFADTISKIFYAVSHEESKFQLFGALLEVNEKGCTMVATDGHRLALSTKELNGGGDVGKDIIIPRKALSVLHHQFNVPLDLEIKISEHHLSFRMAERELTCRILEGTFPDYERVISKDNDKCLTFNKKELAGVLKRVSLLVGDRSRAVRLVLSNGSATFEAQNPDLGEANEEIIIDYCGPSFTMGVNPDYLQHFLQSCPTDEVRLEVKNATSQMVAYPVNGTDKRQVCVIMPIRL